MTVYVLLCEQWDQGETTTKIEAVFNNEKRAQAQVDMLRAARGSLNPLLGHGVDWTVQPWEVIG